MQEEAFDLLHAGKVAERMIRTNSEPDLHRDCAHGMGNEGLCVEARNSGARLRNELKPLPPRVLKTTSPNIPPLRASHHVHNIETCNDRHCVVSDEDSTDLARRTGRFQRQSTNNCYAVLGGDSVENGHCKCSCHFPIIIIDSCPQSSSGSDRPNRRSHESFCPMARRAAFIAASKAYSYIPSEDTPTSLHTTDDQSRWAQWNWARWSHVSPARVAGRLARALSMPSIRGGQQP
mmetsp:Transcript_61574/g.165438  ORF Transcript_61574/g.165438 Transcript_61574/m.165438 type:complete len:234 (+) Transcript_61574:116-817(+)